MTELRFYLDENIDPEVARQLARGGIDAICVRDLQLRGDTDLNHLKRATEMGYALCTHDSDFLKMHAESNDHAGIIFAHHDRARIGG